MGWWEIVGAVVAANFISACGVCLAACVYRLAALLVGGRSGRIRPAGTAKEAERAYRAALRDERPGGGSPR